MTWQSPKTNWLEGDVLTKNDFNRIEGNIAELKKAEAIEVQDVAGNFDAGNVEGALQELAGTVQDGKSAIASSLTAMNQPATSAETHAQLAGKIRDISKDADAGVGNVLAGKTFYQGGAKRAGTMPNRGRAIITPGTTNKPIAQGYHDGTGYVATDVNLKPENIKDGVSIFGVTGSFKMLIILAAGDDIVLYTRPYVNVYNEYDGSDFVKKLEVKIHESGSIRIRFSLRGAVSVFDGSYKGYGYAQIYKNGAPVGTLRTVKSDIYTTFTEDFAVAKNDLIQLYLRTTTSYTSVTAEDFQIKIVSPEDLGYVVEQTL